MDVNRKLDQIFKKHKINKYIFESLIKESNPIIIQSWEQKMDNLKRINNECKMCEQKLKINNKEVNELERKKKMYVNSLKENQKKLKLSINKDEESQEMINKLIDIDNKIVENASKQLNIECQHKQNNENLIRHFKQFFETTFIVIDLVVGDIVNDREYDQLKIHELLEKGESECSDRNMEQQ